MAGMGCYQVAWQINVSCAVSQNSHKTVTKYHKMNQFTQKKQFLMPHDDIATMMFFRSARYWRVGVPWVPWVPWRKVCLEGGWAALDQRWLDDDHGINCMYRDENRTIHCHSIVTPLSRGFSLFLVVSCVGRGDPESLKENATWVYKGPLENLETFAELVTALKDIEIGWEIGWTWFKYVY